MNENKNHLSKVLGRTDIIAIGFGTMVGWSWVMMVTSWINQAGLEGTLCAFLLGGMIILAVGLTYGELTSALPLAGGEFVFTYRAMGKNAACAVGWIMAMAYMGVAAWEGISIATAIDFVLPIPSVFPLWEVAGYQVYLSWVVVGVCGALIITLLNFFGMRPAILFQVMAAAALMIVVLIIFFGGISFGSVENIGKPLTSFEGFSYVLLMVPAMLIGFDVIPQSAEEMNIGPRNVGKMVLVCIVVSMTWYFVLIIGVSLAAPFEIRDSGIIPMAEVAEYLFGGEIFSVLVVLGGIFGILTSWNGFFMGATRLIFAMGRAGVIPAVFGRVHKKYGSPYAAVLLVGAICMAAPFLGMNALNWFMNTSAMCALFSYIFVVASFVILKKKEPELQRPLRIGGGIGFGVLILVVICSYFILYMASNFSVSEPNPEFIIVFLWLLLGAVMVFAGRRASNVSRKEQELLIFGEHLARKGGKYEK